MSKLETKGGHRIYYLDLLRCIACLFVIVIHASSRYVKTDFGSFDFWVGNVLDSFAKVGVPLFVMISGALMLDEHYEFNTKKLVGHIKKMILFFVFWSAVYCLIFEVAIPVFLNHESVSVLHIIRCFVEGHVHLWFVYMIVGLYLIVPLLRLWVKEENKKYVEYFLVLAMVFAVILPQIISIGTNYSDVFEKLNVILEKELYLQYVGGFTVYFILGWYLNRFDVKNKTVLYVLGIAGFVVSAIGTYVLSVTTGVSKKMDGNLTINVFLQAVAVFLFIKTKFYEKNLLQRLVDLISKNSLGIYAVHLMIVHLVYKAMSMVGLSAAIITIPIAVVVTLVLSCAVAVVFRKLPLLKKVV